MNLKKINRRQLRGQSLDDERKKAHTITEQINKNEFVFCFGLLDAMTDEPVEKCSKCGAHIDELELLIEKARTKI